MEPQKQNFYINIQSHEIARDPYHSEWDFKVEATEQEIAELEQLFDENHKTDWESYMRSHVPFLEYHHDPQNKEFDQRLQAIYAWIYVQGDAKTREQINSLGIFGNKLTNDQNKNFK